MGKASLSPSTTFLACLVLFHGIADAIPIDSSLPDANATATFSNSSAISQDYLFNSTSPNELILVYPISGYYAPLQRALYWTIIIFTILGLGNVWLVTAAFGTAMTYSSVAAVHSIAMYAVVANVSRQHGGGYQYYDADALVICEILFCTSVLLPSWLAHYRCLRSTTAQIVLRLWGMLLFIGGVVAFVFVIKVNANVVAQGNDCLASVPFDAKPDLWEMVEWISSPAVRAACGEWRPYDDNPGALQPMRKLDEIVLVRGDTQHRLADWMHRITILGSCGCTFCILFIVYGFLWPESKSLEAHRRSQLQKLRKTKRNPKGNHPADTIQMPLAWVVGIITFVFFEITIAIVPVSEQPQAMGQWGPWVAAVFVMVAVLINHYLEVPIGDMTAALGKALGPTIWFVLDWRGKAPSPQQERARQKAKRDAETQAMKDHLERERRSRMRTQETQTEEVQMPREEGGEQKVQDLMTDPVARAHRAPPSLLRGENDLVRRYSESDIGMQRL